MNINTGQFPYLSIFPQSLSTQSTGDLYLGSAEESNELEASGDVSNELLSQLQQSVTRLKDKLEDSEQLRMEAVHDITTLQKELKTSKNLEDKLRQELAILNDAKLHLQVKAMAG